MGINFDQIKHKLRTPSLFEIEIDPLFFWNDKIPEAAVPTKLEEADKSLENKHEAKLSVFEPSNKPPIEEKKDTNILQEEGNIKIEYEPYNFD